MILGYLITPLYTLNTTCILTLFHFILDYGILERHNQLDNTIGVLDMEMESYEKSKLMAWIFYPTWILLTIMQAVCFVLYNGKFHPLSKILDGHNDEIKGMSQLHHLDLFLQLNNVKTYFHK